MDVVYTVLIVIIVLLILYYFFGWMFNNYTQLSVMQNGTTYSKIDNSKIPANTSNNYAYSVWFYVEDWNYRYGETKNLLTRKDNNSDYYCPRINLGARENDIDIDISLYPDKKGNHLATDSILHTTTVKNFPLQKWVNLMISLYGRTLDIYIDGKLVRSDVLPSIARSCGNADIHVTPDGGFKGWTANIQYWDKALNPQEAYNVYMNGYGGSIFGAMFNKYRIKVSFLDNNKEQGSFEI